MLNAPKISKRALLAVLGMRPGISVLLTGFGIRVTAQPPKTAVKTVVVPKAVRFPPPLLASRANLSADVTVIPPLLLSTTLVATSPTKFRSLEAAIVRLINAYLAG